MMNVSKSKKEKLIQTTGDFSQAKVKSYNEREDLKSKNPVSKGKDITFNQLQTYPAYNFPNIM